MFMPNWSAKAEYLYYDLGNVSMTGVTTRIPVQQTQFPANTWTSSTYNGRVNGNLVRAGVNYHLNFSSAPVVAKY
jgi:outer membrane immunogenic protein